MARAQIQTAHSARKQRYKCESHSYPGTMGTWCSDSTYIRFLVECGTLQLPQGKKKRDAVLLQEERDAQPATEETGCHEPSALAFNAVYLPQKEQYDEQEYEEAQQATADILFPIAVVETATDASSLLVTGI